MPEDKKKTEKPKTEPKKKETAVNYPPENGPDDE